MYLVSEHAEIDRLHLQIQGLEIV